MNGTDSVDTALLRDAALTQRSSRIHVAVDDPEVLAAIAGLDAAERDRFLVAALRVGVIALRAASGHVDAAAVADAGKVVVSEVRELLAREATSLVGDVTTELKRYFDPSTGVLHQRIERLVARDGELERVLASAAGAADTQFAKTLSDQVGEGSPIFALLSPTDQRGLRAQIATFVEGALA